MHSGYTICTAMYGNGVGTGGVRHMMPKIRITHWARPRGLSALVAAAVGPIQLRLFDPRFGATSFRNTGSVTLASALSAPSLIGSSKAKCLS